MGHEMRQQPDVLAALFARRREIADATRRMVPKDLVGIAFVARGSSDHAAIFGRYLLEAVSGKPGVLAAPSLSILYGQRTDFRRWLAVAVSQSGQTRDVVATFRELRQQGAVGVAITNASASPLTDEADLVIDLGAGEERAVPATKTFSAELAAFVAIAEGLGPPPWGENAPEHVPDVVARTLFDERTPHDLATGLAVADSVFCTSRGYLFPVALEAALKLKEIAQIHAEGYSSGDLRHGPIILASGMNPVVAFRTRGPGARDIDELVRTLRSRAAEVIVVGDDARADLPLLGDLPEPLMVFPAAVRAQQLALSCSGARGFDPDHPSGLSKVTW